MHQRTKSQVSSSQPQSNTKKQVKNNKPDEKTFELNLQKIKYAFAERVNKHINKNVMECDRGHIKDPQRVSEYTSNIMKHYLATEVNNQPKVKYMEKQKYINERMRSILVDWIIEVHYQFKLKVESLFLTINFIDRFLEKV